MKIKLTTEQVMEVGELWGDVFLSNLPLEEYLSRHKPQEIFSYYKPKEYLSHHKPEEIFSHYKPEEIGFGLRFGHLFENREPFFVIPTKEESRAHQRDSSFVGMTT